MVLKAHGRLALMGTVDKTSDLLYFAPFPAWLIILLESEIVDKLYSMIRDRDTHVVVNAILALEAILVDEGGIVINQNIATHLIQRYKEWNPSQLQVILGILCRYKPQISDDVYEIMVTAQANKAPSSASIASRNKKGRSRQG